jgi:hypothetical protein
MISFEVRANGSLIAAVNCVNRRTTEKWDIKRGPQCEYEWTSMLFPYEVDAPCTTHNGTLLHYRGDGAVALMRAIADAILKATRKGCATELR